MEKGYPLIIVFYLDREMMANHEILNAITTQVNEALTVRDANALAFFLPTDSTERVECINPIIMEEPDMKKINDMIEEIKVSFDVGQGADDGITYDDDVNMFNSRNDD
tara:strand:+ start:99167 stop:99490 length:324 start_codon:yes stop_codon:yes gene_type:complete